MGISIWQIVLVLVIILILFGAGKIPRVMGDVAKGIKSFKAGMKEEEFIRKNPQITEKISESGEFTTYIESCQDNKYVQRHENV